MQTRIISMAPGGFGIARIDGMVHFVPETVTGDRVEIETVTKKKHYVFSRLVRLLAPSSFRRTPFCPWYAECGGCSFQHIAYPDQLRIKKEIFRDQMERIGKFKNPGTPEILGFESKRIRMRFQIRGGEIGFFQRRSNRLCVMSQCAVADETINEVLQAARKALKKMPEQSGLTGELTVLTSGGKAHLAMDLPERPAVTLSESLGPPVIGCIIGKGERRRIMGKPALPFTIGGFHLDVPADVFLQANPEINEAILSEIRIFMKGTVRGVDLYCGCGNFTFPLAKVCKEAVGIEESPIAVEAARKSALQAGIGNLSFFCRTASGTDLSDADGLVLDPPRPGLTGRLIEGILRATPRRIAYLSCNPSTQTRDLRPLVDAGYTIRSIRLYDMFPHTHHIESLALLTRG